MFYSPQNHKSEIFKLQLIAQSVFIQKLTLDYNNNNNNNNFLNTWLKYYHKKANKLDNVTYNTDKHWVEKLKWILIRWLSRQFSKKLAKMTIWFFHIILLKKKTLFLDNKKNCISSQSFSQKSVECRRNSFFFHISFRWICLT